MRCSTAQKIISAIASPGELERHTALDAHAGACPACRRLLGDHLRLLELLDDPPPLPSFEDLTGRVLERIDGPRPPSRVVWRWAAAAALAFAGLTLGYRLGVGASASTEAARPIVSTYQEALYGLPSDSTEMAYLDNAVSVQSIPERSLP